MATHAMLTINVFVKAIPWLWPGIDRVFVPSFHDRRGHGSHSHSDEDITSRVSDDFDEKVSENEVDFDMNEFNPREAIMGDSASEYDDEIEEGSGENTFVRKRRSSQYSQMDRFSICTSSNSPGLVPSGMCHQNFIFCKSVGAGLLAACPVGDLFDSKYYNVSFAKDRTIDANSVPLYSYWKKPRCLDNTFYVMECDENFMKCSNGHFYPMKCPEGLVFNRVSHQCDYPSTVPTCTEVLPSKLVNHKSHIKHPTDRTASGDPIVPVISGALIDHSRNKLHQAVEDLCSSLHDGMHSDGCTASFVICRHGKIQASMNCPQGTWFDEERAMCDYREKVAACSGALHCTSPYLSLVLLNTCDSREHVPDCQNLEERHPTTGVEVSVSNKVDHSCVYNKKRPAFALGFCGRTYGVCSEDGIQSHQECSVGFLFDSHLNTCVPDEQCGHGRVKDILNEMLSVPFVATASTTENMFKNVRKKDGRCGNSVDGSLKPLGRCRSSYIKCVDGVAVIEPCSTTAEVFSSAVDKCVLRINAPECYEKPQRSRASQLSTSGGVAAFCRSRADGLYRDPADCSGILQCFGGDVFEYPSCSTGLVFNEESVLKGCRGASHGDFVADEADCLQFYRCVWDRLELMRCPSGTVFNPKLSYAIH
ncbi:chitin binding Peritrophin-A domain protein [Dictyocaulus viviparus]|uniref:Chitin binding Peritrophin-A domain protein n=1 Tax=Dictyocaulus viviparus TaxID=29172 RepID=A0A0D8XB85_DICVI|nr:chitin binding Peritrophin-A domain protein [Dictyocaulus viviparus]